MTSVWLTPARGAKPVAGARHPAVQRLQFFLSESRWDPGQVNARRLELLRADLATAPHGGGVLIDDSGDRKDGTKTAHVGRHGLGRRAGLLPRPRGAWPRATPRRPPAPMRPRIRTMCSPAARRRSALNCSAQAILTPWCSRSVAG